MRIKVVTKRITAAYFDVGDIEIFWGLDVDSISIWTIPRRLNLQIVNLESLAPHHEHMCLWTV